MSLGGWGRIKVGSSGGVEPLTGQSDWLELPSDPTLSYSSQKLRWIVKFQSRHWDSAGSLSQWCWHGGGWISWSGFPSDNIS